MSDEQNPIRAMPARFLLPAAAILLAIATAVVAASVSPGEGRSVTKRNVDSIIGRGGFNALFPVTPGPGERERLQARLAYLEDLLRSRDVRNWPDALVRERARNIERLHEYRLRGRFPINEDHPDRVLPCFIDRHGSICAVGYLIEQSAGRDFAEWLDRRYRYATVAQMSSPALDAWIARSGLTRAEVITIQEPGFVGDQPFGDAPGNVMYSSQDLSAGPSRDSSGGRSRDSVIPTFRAAPLDSAGISRRAAAPEAPRADTSTIASSR